MISIPERLATVVPKERISDSPSALAAFESDGLTAFAQKPVAVVIPQTTQEAIDVVQLCHDHGIPFVARGSGTSLSGGAMPVPGGIVISLNRLNRILTIDAGNRIAVVETGVVNSAISQAAAEYGLHFAPDPSSGAVCTIGGNVAFNSGGAHCLKYGMTSNHVLGMKVVTASGQVVEIGGQTIESVGPDLPGLFCGSEGLFGIALEMTVRLLPIAECFHTVLVGYDRVGGAGDAVSAVIASGILPGAMEIMDALSIEAAEAAVACDYPKGANAVLIIELEGPREKVNAEKAQLQEILNHTNPMATMVAADNDHRLAIWRGRKSVFSAVGRLSPDFLVQDGVVPRSRLGQALERIESISREMEIPVANVFHAGDGNLHPLIMFDASKDGMLKRAEETAGLILDVCIEMGGSITGEHGVGIEKRNFLPKMYDEPTMNMLQRLRAAFDPKGISNPGKMFPDDEAPALVHSGLHPLEKAGVISRE